MDGAGGGLAAQRLRPGWRRKVGAAGAAGLAGAPRSAPAAWRRAKAQQIAAPRGYERERDRERDRERERERERGVATLGPRYDGYEGRGRGYDDRYRDRYRRRPRTPSPPH